MEAEMASLVMPLNLVEESSVPLNLVEESSVPPNLVEESSESSSIGAASPDCSDEEEEQEVVVESKRNEGSFGSLESLEDALPIKRGLSNFFPGKSKSFANLSDAAGSGAEHLFKHENPFNKRRRLLMMSTMRRASYASLVTAAYQTVEEADEEEESSSTGSSSSSLMATPLNLHGSDYNFKKRREFTSPRCFSLSDLRHEENS